MSLFNPRRPQQQMTQAQAQSKEQMEMQRQKGQQAMQQAQARRPSGFGGYSSPAPQQKASPPAPPGAIFPQQLTPAQAKAMETQRTTYNPNPMNLGPSDIPLDGYPQNTSRNPMYDPFNPLDNSPAVASPIGTTGTGGGTTQSANPLQSSSGMGLGASNAAYMAKGGKVKSKAKVKKYAKGGSVSSASKRADGCATKGRTKGRML